MNGKKDELRAQFAERKSKMPQHIVEVHELSWKHKALILASKQCGCFHSCQRKIEEWPEREGTAICPRCGIHSVLPEKSGVGLTAELLEEMHRYWF